jgi:hypothetical protein
MTGDGVDEVGRGAHDDALAFLAGLGLSGVPSAEVYAAALGEGTTGSPVDPELEGHLRVGEALDDVVRCDGAPLDDADYAARLLDAAERLNVEGF